MGSPRLRHGDAVLAAAYTPDGKMLVTAGRDRTVRLWDLATGKETRRFDWGNVQPEAETGPSESGAVHKYAMQFLDRDGWASQVALSSDGNMVAASRRGTVCIWQTATGKKLRDLHTGQKWLSQLSFSDDGKTLLSVGSGHTTAIWEVATGKCVRRQGKPAGATGGWLDIMKQSAIVSSGRKYLAWQNYSLPNVPTSIHIRDLATDKELPSINTTMEATALTFSPDEKTVVWAQFLGPIRVSEVATGKELRRLGDKGEIVTHLVVSPNGKSLAACRNRDLELWDLTSGKQTGRITGGSWANPDMSWQMRPLLAFSPDSKKLVVGRGLVMIRQFHSDTGKEILGTDSGHRASLSELALSADGKSVWTHGRGDPLRCWDWATGRETGQRQLPGSATLAVVRAEGGFAYVADQHVTLCDMTGKQTGKIAPGKYPLAAIALSPDGTLLATRDALNRGDPAGIRDIHLWDARTMKKRHALGPASDTPTVGREVMTETMGVVPPDLVFSPDGRFLAGAGPTRQLCLWDVSTGTVLWELTPQAGLVIERFAFSPCGRFLASVNADRTMSLFEAASGSLRGRLGKADSKSATVYMTGTGKGRSETSWRPGAPICLAFSPDGRYLAMAQDTPAIHLWDVLAGREVGRLEGQEGGVASLLFTPDGKHLISGGTDTTALTWDLGKLTTPRPGQSARLHPRELEALWSDLASKDATRAFTATRKLCASPEQAVSLLKEHLRPATPADPKRLAQLVADLQSDHAERRRQAQSELAALGELGAPALRKALADDPPLGLRQRLEQLLKVSGKVPPADKLRELRAVEVLELIGSPAARALLRTLAGGAGAARLSREASSSSHRLNNRVVKP
jgi:WD40 repeat protein